MKKLVYLFIFILLFCLITLGILITALNTDKGQNYATNFIENLITENIGNRVKIASLKISWPFKIKLGYFSVADETGEWIKVEKAEIKIQPLNLLHKELTISSLQATNIILLHTPHFSSVENSTASNSNLGISIKKVNFPSIFLSSKLNGSNHNIVMSLSGDLVYDSSKKLMFNAEVSILKDLNDLLKSTKIYSSGYYIVADQILNLEKNVIKTEAFVFEGTGLINLKDETIKGKYELAFDELRKLNENLQGHAASKFNIHGSFKHLMVNGEIKTENIEYLDKNLPNLLFSHELNYDIERKSGSLKIREQYNNSAFNSDFNFSNNNIEFNQLELLAEQGSFLAKLTYNLEHHTMDGDVKAHISDLSMLSRFCDYKIEGEGTASLQFSTLNKIQAATINISSKSLYIDDYNASIDAKANIEDLWNVKLNNSTIKIEDLKYKVKPIFKTIVFTAANKNNVFNFIIQGVGSLDRKLNFELDGNFRTVQNKKLILNFTKSKTIFGNNEFKITQPATIEYEDRGLKYNMPNLQIAKGKISSNGFFSKNAIYSNISLKQLPITLLETKFPREFTNSVINGDIKLDGKVADPVIKTHLNISNINFIANDQSQLILNSNYMKNILTADTVLKSDNKNHAAFKLIMPIQLSLMPFKIQVEKDEKISGNLNCNLRIDSLAPLFLSPIHKIKGQLNTDLKLGGSVNNPQLNGAITIKEGKYEHAAAGIKLKNIYSHVMAHGKSLILQEFKAHDTENSTLKGNGKWILNQKNMPFDISFIANNFYFLNHQNIQATINGTLKINGDTNQSKITGQIEPVPLEIQLPEQFKKEIPELNITKTVLAPGEQEEVSEVNFFDSYKVDTDISFIAKNKIFIRGWGVEAELSGKLTCKGPINDPVIKGKLETIRGRYQEFGKQLTIKEGRLTFEGAIPPSPYLNITGNLTQYDNEIRVILSGPILKPQLSIESSPSMPQEEALSALLFGKQSAQISPFQAVQLAESLRRLSSKGGGGMNILDKARGILKVDDIKVKNDSEDAKNAALGVGKHLTDKVYLEIEKGTQAGTGKTRVEVEIINNLSIESSVGESGSNSIGVNWRRDY